MFLRFVVHHIDSDSGRRQGLFQAMGELQSQGSLLEYELSEYRVHYAWFKNNLPIPTSFAKASRPHAKKVALSWFKESAVEHIRRMRRVSGFLLAHDVAVDTLLSDRPGYVVYEDEFQIVAEPFSDTPT